LSKLLLSDLNNPLWRKVVIYQGSRHFGKFLSTSSYVRRSKYATDSLNGKTMAAQEYMKNERKKKELAIFCTTLGARADDVKAISILSWMLFLFLFLFLVMLL
jgi:hypothetical protein